ncbi:MAG: hypothetical protein RLZZ15_3684 [Verrucomicrobiota bacterium]
MPAATRAAARTAAIAQGAALTDPVKRDLFERLLSESRRRRVLGTSFDRASLLARIGAKYDRAALLEHIGAPNALVEPQWQLVTVALRDGTAPTLKIAGGLVEKIPAAQVASVSASRTSAMPEGLLQNLTAPEAADLIAFLAALK